MDPSLTYVASQPRQKAQTLLQVVFFANDCALVAHTETDLQLMLDRFSDAPNNHPTAPTIDIDDTTFTNVEPFKYLGSTISCDGSLDKELGTRQGRHWADYPIDY